MHIFLGYTHIYMCVCVYIYILRWSAPQWSIYLSICIYLYIDIYMYIDMYTYK